MPYRIDARIAGAQALERLIDLGALDVESSGDGHIAALMPDTVTVETAARALAAASVSVSPAVGRDADSVWRLTPRPIRIGRVRIIPADDPGTDAGIRLVDGPAFGTGLHPTTALCLEALDEIIGAEPPDALLDVGTGSGILTLAALTLGVSRATAIDIDEAALRVAAANAQRNGLEDRLQLVLGGPEAVEGSVPLVAANVLAAPLMEMAPVLVRRIGHYGRVVLSGIPASAGEDVTRVYRHLGLQHRATLARGGWVALVLQASW